MEIVVEKQPNCLANLRATVSAAEVKSELDILVRDYRKQAKLPGFRPGKAPAAAVARKYQKDIAEDVVKNLVGEVVNKAVKDHQLTVLNFFDVQHGEVGEKDLELTLQLTLEPEFSLPDLDQLDVEITAEGVTEELVQAQLSEFAEQMAKFVDVTDRALQMGDYGILDYDATVDGQALSSLSPDVPSHLMGGKEQWVHMHEESLLPGFCSALVGMAVGEERPIEVEATEEAGTAELKGKKIAYKVTLKSIKAKEVPELTEELAMSLFKTSLAEMKDSLRKRLEEVMENETLGKKRLAALEHLIKTCSFDVPVAFLVGESRQVMKEIVEEEQKRGLSDEEVLSRKEEIIKHAQMNAQLRVRADFILSRIARDMRIEVSNEELVARIVTMAARLGMSTERLAKQVSKRRGFAAVSQEIRRDKALDFLANKVKVKNPADKA